MVYCGKPSKGCQTCRDRKTRCDRVTPSCGQCVRAHRTCPGYRSELDLMFRNESESVMSKAKAREKKTRSKPPSPPAFASSSNAAEDFNQSSPNQQVVPFDMQRHTGDFVQLLQSNHTLGPSLNELSQSYFNNNSPTFLRTLDIADGIASQTSADEHLLSSMSAVGLASFSNAVHAPELMIRARREYVNALQLTNAALRSSTEAKKDSTLYAVMILSIFETVTGNTERSLAAWTEHVNGAAALVNLRGRDQFKTEAGIRMFNQVVSNLMLSCIQRAKPMPDFIIKLRKESEKFMDMESPTWRLAGIIIDFSIFRSDVRDSKIVGPRAVIDAGLPIDRRFVALVENLPESWRYRTVYTDEDPDIVWNGSYHVYNQYWMAHVWNGMRVCRIMLHEIIRDALLTASTAIKKIFTDKEASFQNEASTNIMLQMRAEILGSVPQHTLTSLDNTPASLLDGTRSYFVLWPLFLIGSMDITTEPIRQWVIARLRYMGDKVGIKQALILADLLVQRREVEDWKRKPEPAPLKHGVLERWGEGGASRQIEEL